MRCENCRTELSDTAKFCNNCGNSVRITPLAKTVGTKKSGNKPFTPPGKEEFPWGRVSFNPFKWNPLGLTRTGAWIYGIVLTVIILNFGFKAHLPIIWTISEGINIATNILEVSNAPSRGTVSKWINKGQYEKVNDYISKHQHWFCANGRKRDVVEFCLSEALRANVQRYKTYNDLSLMIEFLPVIPMANLDSRQKKLVDDALTDYPPNIADSLLICTLRKVTPSYTDMDMLKANADIYAYFSKPTHPNFKELIDSITQYNEAFNVRSEGVALIARIESGEELDYTPISVVDKVGNRITLISPEEKLSYMKDSVKKSDVLLLKFKDIIIDLLEQKTSDVSNRSENQVSTTDE